jgi:hypothetical protein
MISLIEPTSTTRYVYFNDSGMITSISGREAEETTDSYAFFEIEEVNL